MAILNNTEKNIHTKTVSWDENGVAEGSIVYRIGASSAVQSATDTKSHPDYSYLKRVSGAVTFLEGDMAEVTIEFSGIDPANDGQVTSTFKATSTNEPIDTHPTFNDWADKFGVITNEDGSFKKFDSKLTVDGQEVDNPKAGIMAYLDPSVTFEQTKTFAKADLEQLQEAIENIGFIDDGFYTGEGIPKAPTPDGDDGKKKNWLLISGNYEQIGEGGRVTKVWKLSGRRQWDEILYKKPAGGNAGGLQGASLGQAPSL